MIFRLKGNTFWCELYFPAQNPWFVFLLTFPFRFVGSIVPKPPKPPHVLCSTAQLTTLRTWLYCAFCSPVLWPLRVLPLIATSPRYKVNWNKLNFPPDKVRSCVCVCMFVYVSPFLCMFYFCVFLCVWLFTSDSNVSFADRCSNPVLPSRTTECKTRTASHVLSKCSNSSTLTNNKQKTV